LSRHDPLFRVYRKDQAAADRHALGEGAHRSRNRSAPSAVAPLHAFIGTARDQRVEYVSTTGVLRPWPS
jgi:hypothetical protein